MIENAHLSEISKVVKSIDSMIISTPSILLRGATCLVSLFNHLGYQLYLWLSIMLRSFGSTITYIEAPDLLNDDKDFY